MDREDYAYGTWKQDQIDRGLWKSKMGSALPPSQRVQKYVNQDPNPNVPFITPEVPKLGKRVVILCLLWILFITLNPFGWPW